MADSPAQVYELRFGELARVPDVVVWPGSHAQVEAVVALANQYNVVIIPYGGGTSVSGALQVRNPRGLWRWGCGLTLICAQCPKSEKRMIVSLDMHLMNAIKWIDRDNMLVCMEAGIIGQDIKRRLEALGTTRHPPKIIPILCVHLSLS